MLFLLYSFSSSRQYCPTWRKETQYMMLNMRNTGGASHMAHASMLSTRNCFLSDMPNSICWNNWFHWKIIKRKIPSITWAFLDLFIDPWLLSPFLNIVLSPSSIVLRGFLLFFMNKSITAYSIRAANTKKIQTTR